MRKEQREELLTQIEMFLGMGLLSLLVASIYWGKNSVGIGGEKRLANLKNYRDCLDTDSILGG